MDHTEAVRLQAVEKYILGELSPLLRARFEEHFFDCADCALNLRAGVAFAAASRQFFAESAAPETEKATPRHRWFGWWKPMVLVPAFAALLFVVGYQNLVTIPQLKHSDLAAEVEAPPAFSLINASVHGSAGPRCEIKPGQSFDLWFDVTPDSRNTSSYFTAYLQDSLGNRLSSLRVSRQRAQTTVTFHAPAGLQAGQYKLVVLGESGNASSAPIGEFPFTVDFIK